MATSTKWVHHPSEQAAAVAEVSALEKEYCDACHAPGVEHISRAYVLVQLPTGSLTLCYHHANAYQARLEELGGVIVLDERHHLTAASPGST